MEVNAGYKKNYKSCEEKIINIYNIYLNDITPLIITIETIDSVYPAEITNEIRATFTHLARYYEFINVSIEEDDNAIVERLEAQIGLAERHMKRCKLDCYKYLCLSIYDQMQKFDSDYKGVDLSYVRNGEFIKELHKLRKEAYNEYQQAKKMDTKRFLHYSEINDYNLSTVDSDYPKYCEFICDDDIYRQYEKAYEKYSECMFMIEENSESINFSKKKATVKDIKANVGIAIGIIGILLSIIIAIIPN